MKKYAISLILPLVIALFFVSCSDDDDDNPTNPTTSSFEISSKDENVSGNSSDFELVSHAEIINISDQEKTMNVRMEMVDLIEGHSVAICTNLCFQEQTDDWSVPDMEKFSIPAGGSTNFLNGNSGFTAHHYPNGVSGTSKVKFIFYNVDDPDDKVEYIATFSVL